jgi:hypothetical protein
MNYRVLVNDIFCYMDQSRKYTHGEYSTCAEALAVCREIVDNSLRHECAPGMPAISVRRLASPRPSGRQPLGGIYGQ